MKKQRRSITIKIEDNGNPKEEFDRHHISKLIFRVGAIGGQMDFQVGYTLTIPVLIA
jgi:hypothetical protein